MIQYCFLIGLVIFFTLNMGGSNFAASFAAAYGSKVLSKRKLQILFLFCAFIGAITLGRPVVNTLSSKIIPQEVFSFDVVIIFLISTTVCLFLANLMHVPQSTSLVTVGALLGIGLYFNNIEIKTFLYLIPFWVFLPIIGYFATYFIGGLVYPPRKKNFWIFEKIVNHQGRLKMFIILSSCYNAFSVGTNNVANAVGPLSGARIIDQTLGLALIAPIFGLGGFVFSKALITTGERIVPLGLLTSSILCLITGTLVIIASIFGVPQSFVMIKVVSVFAISDLKNGRKLTYNNPVTRKTYMTWVVTPILAVLLSYLLTWVKHVLFK